VTECAATTTVLPVEYSVAIIVTSLIADEISYGI